MASLQYLGNKNLCMPVQRLMALQLFFPTGWQDGGYPGVAGLQRAINSRCPREEELHISSRSSWEKLGREVAIRNEDLWCAQKSHSRSADCHFDSPDLHLLMIARELAFSMKMPSHLFADFISVT